MTYGRELQVAESAAREAAELLVREATRGGGPRGSGDRSPVDGEMGALLCRRLGEAFPEDTVVCEEGGSRRVPGSRRAFLVDPHDGTRSFLAGRRETAVSIGLVDRGRLVLGVIVAPLGTPLTGPGSFAVTWADGGRLLVDGSPAAPAAGSGELTPDDAVLVSTNLSPASLERNREAVHPARLVRCASIATRLALVAAGRATLAVSIRRRLAVWDFAAGQALLEARGGALVGTAGEPIRWQGIELHPDDREQRGYFGARTLALARLGAARYRRLIP